MGIVDIFSEKLKKNKSEPSFLKEKELESVRFKEYKFVFPGQECVNLDSDESEETTPPEETKPDYYF